MGRWAGYFLFFLIVTAVYAGAHYFLYSWFTRWANPSAKIRHVVGVLFIVLVFSFPVSRILGRYDFNFATYLSVLIASIWMGLVLYFFILALLSDILDLLLRVLRLRQPILGSHLVRFRRFWVFVITVVVFSIGGYSLYQAEDLRVTRLTMPLKGLPKSLEGFSIVQISDFHYGIINSNAKLERVIEKTNALDADVVFITGDLFDESVAHMEEMEKVLPKLKGRHGVFAVTGNHEYYAGVTRAVGIMQRSGVRVLRNEVASFPGGLQILGIDDPTGIRRMGEKGPDFKALLGLVDPQKPSILLYHQPIRFEETAKQGIGLQLSGHTHGGQLYPIIYISERIYPLTPGLHRAAQTLLYVSRGVGTWGPPMRFLEPPEIVFIRLASTEN